MTGILTGAGEEDPPQRVQTIAHRRSNASLGRRLVLTVRAIRKLKANLACVYAPVYAFKRFTTA